MKAKKKINKSRICVPFQNKAYEELIEFYCRLDDSEFLDLDKAAFFNALYNSNYKTKTFSLHKVYMKRLSNTLGQVNTHTKSNPLSFYGKMYINPKLSDYKNNGNIQQDKFSMLLTYLHEEEHIYQFCKALKFVQTGDSEEKYDILNIIAGLCADDDRNFFSYYLDPTEIMAEYVAQKKIKELCDKNIISNKLDCELAVGKLLCCRINNMELEFYDKSNPQRNIYREQEINFLTNNAFDINKLINHCNFDTLLKRISNQDYSSEIKNVIAFYKEYYASIKNDIRSIFSNYELQKMEYDFEELSYNNELPVSLVDAFNVWRKKDVKAEKPDYFTEGQILNLISPYVDEKIKKTNIKSKAMSNEEMER